MNFTKVQISWLIGSLVIGILLYILYFKYYKTRCNCGSVKNGGSPGSDIFDPLDLDMPVYDPNNLIVGSNTRIIREDDENQLFFTGENLVNRNIYPDYMQSNNEFGFNMYDPTAPRGLSVPLQSKKQIVYFESPNANGGVIRDY